MLKLSFKHFVALNVLDVLTTWYALQHFSTLYESNPIIVWIMANFGLFGGLVAYKLILLGVMYGLINKIPTDIKIKQLFNKNGRQIGYVLICLIFVFVVGNNIYKILTV